MDYDKRIFTAMSLGGIQDRWLSRDSETYTLGSSRVSYYTPHRPNVVIWEMETVTFAL